MRILALRDLDVPEDMANAILVDVSIASSLFEVSHH